MRNNILYIFIMFLIISATANSETVLSSLDDIASYGLEHNLDIKNSQISVLKADENRTGLFLFNNSSISVETSILEGLNVPTAGSNSATGLGYSSTLTVPVIEQVSLSASVDNNLNTHLGISLNPLSHSSTKEESELIYNSSIILANGAMISAQIDAVGSALGWMSAGRDFTTVKREAELSEIRYNDDKVRYELGEISLDELHESLINWSEARVLLSTEDQEFRTSEISFYSSLGAGTDEIIINQIELEILENELSILKRNLDPQLGNALKISSYLISVLEVQSAELNLKNTWVYEPDLSASTGLTFDSSGNLSVEAGVQFSISPVDLQKKKRGIAEEEYNISLIEAAQSLNQAELNFEQTIKSISSSAINSDISRLEREQAEILLSEAELLHKLGEYSELELNESQLTVVKAENSLFHSLTDEYLSWLELKKYM
jgi:Outer membrane efflux protein